MLSLLCLNIAWGVIKTKEYQNALRSINKELNTISEKRVGIKAGTTPEIPDLKMDSQQGREVVHSSGIPERIDKQQKGKLSDYSNIVDDLISSMGKDPQANIQMAEKSMTEILGKATDTNDVGGGILPNPIFIGGCGSSGTTLLRRIMNAHSQIACGKEFSLFDRPMFYRLTMDELKQNFYSQNFEALEDGVVFPIRTSYGSYCGLYLPNALTQYHSPEIAAKIMDSSINPAEFASLFFSSYAMARGKNRWAEKTPNNIFCADKILEFFPDSKFIHVVRDGRDVCHSLINRRKFNPYAACSRWIMAVEAGMRLRGNKRYFELRYEDLVLNPEKAIKNLFCFLDEPFESQVLNSYQSGEKEAFGYGEKPIHAQSIGKWKKANLSEGLKTCFDLLMARQLNLLGYK